MWGVIVAVYCPVDVSSFVMQAIFTALAPIHVQETSIPE